ncbi:carboxymuconolactone decarboxylase family protein [Candidatus Desantisbacteria bacterium]|nr:carboxymuconolactone decarboxylase family protein [Candidatus Desantisbacteria bacterium]
MSKIPSKHYHRIKEHHPEFMKAVEALGKATKQEGPIEEKTAELIQLAAAASIRSEGAVHSHVRRALEAGSPTEEIYHAIILLTSIIGFPAVASAISWANDVIKGSTQEK